MSTLTTWNEAYDFGRAMLGMDEAEAEAFAEAHFVNPDAVVEELHAEPLVEPISQREFRARRTRAEGWPRAHEADTLGMLPGHLNEPREG